MAASSGDGAVVTLPGGCAKCLDGARDVPRLPQLYAGTIMPRWQANARRRARARARVCDGLLAHSESIDDAHVATRVRVVSGVRWRVVW